ncbi:MAG: CDP-diacylglycerol--serine O-phosphatidyltransferase, partial [Pseudomonadota bacterium]
AVFSGLYLLFVGFLMVSSLPTWSGKRAGRRISRRLVVPIMLALLIAVVMLFSYPWAVLSVVCVAYLATIPFSVKDQARRS